MAVRCDAAPPPGRRRAASSTTQVRARRCASGCREVAEHTVAAVIDEVPGYADALQRPMGDTIEAAVQLALGGFLDLAGGSRDADPSTPLGPTLEGAYALGRGEARSGRRWTRCSPPTGSAPGWPGASWPARPRRPGLPAATMAQFAELVFAYIDELSAASVAGHTDELATTGRVRERYLRAARPAPARRRGRRRAGRGAPSGPAGQPPRTLTAVLLPAAQVRGVLAVAGPGTLQVGEDLPGPRAVDDGQPLLAAARPRRRRAGPPRTCCGVLRRAPGRGRPGPARGRRRGVVRPRGAHRGARSASPRDGRPVDTEEHLAELVLSADPDALADLRARVLAPLADLRPATARAAGRDAAGVAAAPGPARRGRRGAARAPPDGALPDGPAARAVRRPAGRPGHRARPAARPRGRRRHAGGFTASEHTDHARPHQPQPEELTRLAVSATLHCLTGCAIGEVLGMVVGTALGWELAHRRAGGRVWRSSSDTRRPWFGGEGRGAVPASGQGRAGRDTVSIAVMEVTDNAVLLTVPGAMDAGLGLPAVSGARSRSRSSSRSSSRCRWQPVAHRPRPRARCRARLPLTTRLRPRGRSSAAVPSFRRLKVFVFSWTTAYARTGHVPTPLHGGGAACSRAPRAGRAESRWRCSRMSTPAEEAGCARVGSDRRGRRC